MKKSTKRILFVTGTAIALIYAYNKFVSCTATKKKLLTKEDGETFSWKHGDVFYTKKGTGSPLLLIHDADSASSSEEWTKLIHKLEKQYTVYAVDLLGCGRSEKPKLEYTNYFYTQLIDAFITEVIGEKTSVVATNMSASFVIMANHMNASLFDKIILINPISIKELTNIPNDLSNLKKILIQLPFIGTFIYNLLTNPVKIDEAFRNKYYANPQLISSILEDTYYEAAHTDESNGRFLYASMIGNYLNNNISHAVKKLTTPTLIIGSNNVRGNALTLDDYHKVNPELEILRINNGSLYPHMEVPEKISSIIKDYL